MLSKEDIFVKNSSHKNYYAFDDIMKSMDQYAKQDAIEFCEWMQRYALYDYSKKPYRYAGRQQPSQNSKPETWTAIELYELYLKSKTS